MPRTLGSRTIAPDAPGYSLALDGKEVNPGSGNPRLVYRNIGEALRGKSALTACGWFFVATQQLNINASPALEGLQNFFRLSYNGGTIAGLRYGAQGVGLTEVQTRPNGIGFTNQAPAVSNRPGLAPRGFWTHVAFGTQLSSALAPGGIADGISRVWVNGVQNFSATNLNWVGASEPNGVAAFLANNSAASANAADLQVGGLFNVTPGDGNASCLSGGLYDIRLYDALLTSDEVLTVSRSPLRNNVRPANLALWLKLNEGAGAGVADSSGRTYAFQHGGALSLNGLQGTAAWSATNTPFGLLP